MNSIPQCILVGSCSSRRCNKASGESDLLECVPRQTWWEHWRSKEEVSQGCNIKQSTQRVTWAQAEKRTVEKT